MRWERRPQWLFLWKLLLFYYVQLLIFIYFFLYILQHNTASLWQHNDSGCRSECWMPPTWIYWKAVSKYQINHPNPAWQLSISRDNYFIVYYCQRMIIWWIAIPTPCNCCPSCGGNGNFLRDHSKLITGMVDDIGLCTGQMWSPSRMACKYGIPLPKFAQTWAPHTK